MNHKQDSRRCIDSNKFQPAATDVCLRLDVTAWASDRQKAEGDRLHHVRLHAAGAAWRDYKTRRGVLHTCIVIDIADAFPAQLAQLVVKVHQAIQTSPFGGMGDEGSSVDVSAIANVTVSRVNS
jgi:hypothetical protein